MKVKQDPDISDPKLGLVVLLSEVTSALVEGKIAEGNGIPSWWFGRVEDLASQAKLIQGVPSASVRAKRAAEARWAKEPNRTAALAPAREGLKARFRRMVDDGTLPAEEVETRADEAFREHMRHLANLRWKRKQTQQGQRPRPTSGPIIEWVEDNGPCTVRQVRVAFPRVPLTSIREALASGKARGELSNPARGVYDRKDKS